MAQVKFRDLKHIPGERGLPYFGNLFPFLADAGGFLERCRHQYGDVFLFYSPFGWTIMLAGQTANKFFLVEQARFTSSQEAWENSLGELFPNGLMLMDGDRHQYHRAIMLDAFKKVPMQGYLDFMPEIIAGELDKLDSGRPTKMFPFFKHLTLKLAGKIFFGLNLDGDLKKVNQAITDIVNASGSVPMNIPFSRYRKGLKGRKTLIRYFRNILPERRRNPGKDLMSKLCLATDESGNRFTDQEVIDHLIFVLMAAHDTTAITLTLMSYFLAKHPDWQQAVRQESTPIQNQTAIALPDLRLLEKTSLVMKETLRLHPPLILVTRKLEKAMHFEGYDFPREAFITLLFHITHRDDRTWSNPLDFDPERFSKERKEHQKCPYAYAPFGAGRHHCIGYAFAEMQIKLVITGLVDRFELELQEGYECPIRDVPLKQPKDDLPMRLKARSIAETV